MFRFSLAKLRVRLLLLVLLAIIPALGLMIYTSLELRQMVADDVRQEALRLVRVAASDQAESIRDTRQLLFALAQISEVRQVDPAACATFLTQLLRQYPQYALLSVLSPDGQIICSAYPPTGFVEVTDLDYVQRVVQTRDFAASAYQLDPVSGKATLNFGYPILDELDQVQAVASASLDLGWLNKLAAQAQLPEGSTFTVIDRNGTVLVRYPDPGRWVGRSVPEAPIIEHILAQPGEGTTESEGVDGVPRLFAFAPLYGASGNGEVYVSIGIPTTVAFANANRVISRNLIGLGLATILAMAAAYFGGYWFILRWVNVLVSTAKRLSTGNLSVRTGLPYNQGELSQLAYAFDEMAESLEQRIIERDQAENALGETQRALSTLLSNLPGMAYRCRNDRERTMEFVSEGCFELTGYSPVDLIASRQIAYNQLMHGDDRAMVWRKIQAALQENSRYRFTYRLITASGEEKWVWEQGRGVFSTEGDLLALEGFVTDATERVLAFQNLEERVAERTRALLALYEVTAVASGSLDLDTILTMSLERILAIMGGELGVIHLVDEAEPEPRLAAWRSVKPDVNPQKNITSPDRKLVNWVFERGQPLVLPASESSSRSLPTLPAGDSRSYAGVPMQARGRVLGVLSLLGQVGQQFNEDTVALLDSIADQIGGAAENALLYESERVRRRQADTLLQVTSVVGSTLDLDEVLARILDQLHRVVEYDSALVQLLQEGRLQVIAARGFANVQQLLGMDLSLTETPNHKVVMSGQPLNVRDAPAQYPVLRRPPFHQVRSWLGVPLRVQERVIGMISVGRRQPGGFAEEQVRLTNAFADQAALALENARLYQQAEQLAVMEERSRLARELHDSVTQAIYSLTLFAEVGRRAAEADNKEQTVDYLTRLGQVAQQALREMRLLVYELRMPALETEGLVQALQQRLDAVEKRAGVEARLLVEGQVELPALVEEGLYRIAQEALNNALKHAEASLVTVSIKTDGERVELEVMDNGRAFDPDKPANAGGMGLDTMRERAERLDGSLTITSRPGEGTRVKAGVPTRRSWSRPILPIDEFSEVT